MGSYFDEHYNKNLAATQAEIKKKQDANTAASNQYVADINAIVDKSTDNAVSKVQGEIDKLPASYQSSFDANAIQQKINERQTAERMANLGMTDSGLNRTQQTAINIQRSNADMAVRTQINSATNSLRQQIADLYASGESQKAENSSKARYELEQKNQSVYDTMMNNLYSNASAYETARIEADAKAEEARIKAAQEQEKWYLQNGYSQDKNGNWVYTGKLNTQNFDMEKYNEAYEAAYNLYDPNDTTKFYDYIKRLSLMGYDRAVLEKMINEVIDDYGSGSTPKKVENPLDEIFNILRGISQITGTSSSGTSSSAKNTSSSSTATKNTSSSAARRKTNRGKG